MLDWDEFMAPASDLAGRDICSSPQLWPAYARLLRSIVDASAPGPVVVLGVCAPVELRDWEIDHWLLLDCSDDVRRARLSTCRSPAELEQALQDGRDYRNLGLQTIDSTDLTPEDLAHELARLMSTLHA